MSSPYIFSQFLGEEVRLIAAINAAGLVETLLYGIHLVLFSICIYLLSHSKRPTQVFILGSAIIMFALSTADVSMTIMVLTHDFSGIFESTNIVQKHIFVKIPIFVTNNFIADLILLYRCYMVWGKSKYVLIGASFLVLADSLWGYLAIGDKSSYLLQELLLPLYVWSIFGINIILTAITVGRIFWVSRIARGLTGVRQKGYRTVMAILLESSLVYSTCIFAYLVYPPVVSRVIMVTICMRVVAIMPTLLIVQVGLGRAIREGDHATPVSDLNFGGRAPSVVLDSVFTSMEARETSIVLRLSPDDEEASSRSSVQCPDGPKKS